MCVLGKMYYYSLYSALDFFHLFICFYGLLDVSFNFGYHEVFILLVVSWKV